MINQDLKRKSALSPKGCVPQEATLIDTASVTRVEIDDIKWKVKTLREIKYLGFNCQKAIAHI